MQHASDMQPHVKEVARLFKKNHLSYDQTRYIFQRARKLAGIRQPKRKGKGTVKRLSRQELRAFLDTAHRKDAKTGLMMLTLYETGVRVDEFVHLQASDLYTEERKIIIRNGKGQKRREVPITHHLCQMLQLYMADKKAEHIFESRHYKLYTTRRIEQIVEEIARESGITSIKVTPHTMRHSRATHLAEDGMSKDELQAFLGHEKGETTEIYTHTAQIDMRRAYDRATTAGGYQEL